MNMYKELMRLIQIFGAANPDIHKLIEYYGDAHRLCEKIDLGECEYPDKNLIAKAKYITADKMQKVIEQCEKRGVNIVSLYDNEYPAILKEIYNPPVLLFYKGTLDCLNNRCITAVGSRDITPYISKLSYRISTDLSKNGITLISGMALGVDSVVHNACVNQGNPTVGVLGCGIFYDYPRGSSFLRNDIIKNGGLILSELLPSVSPSPDYFVARNRIMAGLSGGTVVFQAGMKSGSLITAEYALQEGRDVFCVPPPDMFDERYSGVVDFIRDGAIPVFNHDDILKFYKENY